MQNNKSLRGEVTICASLVNKQTYTNSHTGRQLLTGYTISSLKSFDD